MLMELNDFLLLNERVRAASNLFKVPSIGIGAYDMLGLKLLMQSLGRSCC